MGEARRMLARVGDPEGNNNMNNNTNPIVRWCRGVPITNAHALRQAALSRMGKTWADYKTGDVDYCDLSDVENEIRKEALA